MSDTLSTVLAAAERLRALGPDALTMDALAREAGVSRATLYRLVGSREQLLARLGAAEPADTRQRILDAAGALFGRVGLEAATIESVAREAGVGPATVYRQFGGKDGLVTAFATESAQRRRLLAAAEGPSDDVRADVSRVTRAIADTFVLEGDLMRVVLGEACRGGESLAALRQRPVRTTHAIAALLGHHMDAGRLRRADPTDAARSLFGMVFAHVFLNPLLEGSDPPDADTVVAAVVPLFLDGLAPTGGAS
ncbi:MAG: TetR/AcrR family transcriptional regulator [Myxococcota bacterium]